MIEPFLPMLAARGEPFDSPEYLFEIKWDGVRALSACDEAGWRLWGRDRADYRPRYPELSVLAGLPAGTALDGEIVLLSAGVPDPEALLARHALSRPIAVQQRSTGQPVTYMVFDALYDRGQCLFGWPLARRRELAQARVAALGASQVQFSQGVVGTGRAFFEQAVAQGQEGVLAKHLASRYRPGQRCVSWQKLKPWRTLPAVILGYLPGRQGVRGLLVGALHQGQLRYAALLRSGLSGRLRRQLAGVLEGLHCQQPALPCPERGLWV
ncbi:MAG: DNA ligase [Gemmatimonadales bacterium]